MAKEAAQISLGEVVRIMEGGINITLCSSQETARCASEDFCPLRAVWVKASRAMEEALDAISIQDLLDDYRILSNSVGERFPVCSIITASKKKVEKLFARGFEIQ